MSTQKRKEGKKLQLKTIVVEALKDDPKWKPNGCGMSQRHVFENGRNACAMMTEISLKSN